MLELIGIFIGGLILFALIKGLFRSTAADIRQKKRAHDEAHATAATTLSQGDFRFPTWKNNSQKVELFLKQVGNELVSKGRTAASIKKLMNEPHFTKSALTVAYTFEVRGFSFLEQVVSVSDFMDIALANGLSEQIFQKNEAEEFTESESSSDEEGEKEIEIGGVVFSLNPNKKSYMDQLVLAIKNVVESHCRSEPDFYQYLMHESNRFASGNDLEREVLKDTGISVIEYSRKIIAGEDYPPDPRVIDWLNDEVDPDIERIVGSDLAPGFRAVIFFRIFKTRKDEVQALRLKYAVRSRNDCISSRRFGDARRWDEVISSITGVAIDEDEDIPF